jgi:PAS domain S-box-containing protein
MPLDPELKAYLLAHSLEGIVTTDLTGTVLDSNETALELLGYGKDSLTGEHISALFPPASTSHLLPNLMQMARETAGFDGEIMLQASNGEQIMVRLLIQTWPSDEPEAILFRFLDRRETHEIVRQLKESSQMAVLGNLTRSFSHEILNPIAVIGTFTRRILDPGSMNKDQEEWGRQVISSVERLEDIAETVQTYLELPSPRFSEGSLDDTLDRSLENVRYEAEDKGVRTFGEGDKGLPTGFLDSQLLETAFTAILVNALERMPDGGDLVVTRRKRQNHGSVSIRDSGPVLDVKQIEEDLSPIHVIGGEQFHLNLAIARRIVDDHGGSFWLESSDPQGLTVHITLPTDRRTVERNRGI